MRVKDSGCIAGAQSKWVNCGPRQLGPKDVLLLEMYLCPTTSTGMYQIDVAGVGLDYYSMMDLVLRNARRYVSNWVP